VQVPTRIACPLYVCVGKYAVGSEDGGEVTLAPYCVVPYTAVVSAVTEGIPNKFVAESMDTELAIDKAVTLVTWLEVLEVEVDSELLARADVEARAVDVLELVEDVESDEELEVVEVDAADDIAGVDDVEVEGRDEPEVCKD
jgi:hypothetical protein